MARVNGRNLDDAILERLDQNEIDKSDVNKDENQKKERLIDIIKYPRVLVRSIIMLVAQ